MSYKKNRRIFLQASTTHFFSSLFLTGQTRIDVTALYAFARTADDLVDEETTSEKYYEFKQLYYKDLRIGSSSHEVINDFIELKNRVNIKDEWVDALFNSLEMDLNKRKYQTFEELEEYMYGVAGVIGLMMCKCLNVKETAYPNAIALGYAAQWTNILRDIKEDNSLGRVYIPTEILNKYQLESLEENYISQNKEQFIKMFTRERLRFYEYMEVANKGFKYIPRKFRIAIRTVASMYEFTLNKILKDPLIVYRLKVKPKKRQVIASALYNIAKGLCIFHI